MPRPPDHLLRALQSHLWLESHSRKYPRLGPAEASLVSGGFLEVIQEEPDAAYPWITSYKKRVSAEGKEALATHLTVSELLDLIREGISRQAFAVAAHFVKEIPKELLPELLACGSNEVQRAASERLERLNGVVRRTT